MKLAYLVEVTALVSAHSRLLIERTGQVSSTVLGDYYIHSRNRFNRWMRDLNDIKKGVEIRDPLHLFGLSLKRPPVQSIAEQILINDLLNRVCTVILIASDRHRGESRIEPLARNVFQSHATVRRDVLRICQGDGSLQPEQVIHIDKLRASSERWADFLNCSLMAAYDLWSFAFDENRAREVFHDRFHQDRLDPEHHEAWSLILAGLRHSFPDIDGLATPLHDDDRMITRSIINAFPGDKHPVAAWTRSTVSKTRTA